MSRRRVADVELDGRIELRDLHELDRAEGALLGRGPGRQRLAPQLRDGPLRGDPEDRGPLVGGQRSRGGPEDEKGRRQDGDGPEWHVHLVHAEG